MRLGIYMIEAYVERYTLAELIYYRLQKRFHFRWSMNDNLANSPLQSHRRQQTGKTETMITV
jgi:phage protein U